ncbi:MAG TPA: serine hydrolase [Gemmatimonadaceae bacterium]|nr:serine hydrolase [Gemmatimonadaceae bacterium]
MHLASRAVAATMSLAHALALAAPLAAQAPARRPVRASDIYRIHEVSDPQRSPDGRWVAYVVETVDSAKDESQRDLWMTTWAGDTTIQLTSSPASERMPRWSPDGRWLAFLSKRQGAKATQLWLLDRLGGEASRLTDFPGGIDEYAWSPDGARLAIIADDPDPADSSKSPAPIVIDRYRFKSDGSGYLGAQRSHLYVFDVATKRAQQLTSGAFDEEDPAWSPDGRWIAFASDRDAPDPDRTENSDLFVIEARAGAMPRRLTTYAGNDAGPLSWSPDGREIAYRRGGDPKYAAYNIYQLAVTPVAPCSGATGATTACAPRVLTAALDRSIAEPRWSRDGASIYCVVTDDRTRWVARVPVAGGAAERLTSGERVVTAFSEGPDGKLAVLSTTPTRPNEVFAVERDGLRQLSHQNDAWLSEVRLATTRGIAARGKDGADVHGLLVTPAGWTPGQRLPTLLRIHGGPNLQDQFEFHLERELFAANGYAVVTANYRGSAGRGEKWSRSIFADWGDKEVKDLLAMVDHVVAMGIADPNRLGIGGWSYGAILTNYTIASDHRFRAAISGAGSSLQLAMWGTDQYVVQYEHELGAPWKNQAAWIKVSYPFFHADRITTPTLFLGGDADFNVPLLGSEQMYQSLRSLGVDTRLIIYPGQHHGIGRPSFKRDRLERYLAWYGNHLAPDSAGVAAGSGSAAATAAPQPSATTSTTEAPDVDSIFAAYDRPGVPGASVLVIRDGRVALVKSYGLADLEAGTAATPYTDYRLASLTKQFTAMAVLLLVKDGKLHLDDRVRDVLPGLPAYARDVTIRELLGHTAGLWDYEDFVPDTLSSQVHDAFVLDALRRVDSTYFPPGTRWRYSNTGYVLLGMVVAHVSGESFPRFLHDRIFAPLGMDSTVAYEAGVSTVPRRAYGYSADSAGGFRRTDQSPTSATLGDGGVYTSVHDLVKWNRALDEGTLVGKALQREAWTPGTLAGGARTDYGFGWFVDRDAAGERLWHYGETMGFTNAILKYPERGLTVIVLTNRTGGAPWNLATKVAALPRFGGVRGGPMPVP